MSVGVCDGGLRKVHQLYGRAVGALGLYHRKTQNNNDGNSANNTNNENNINNDININKKNIKNINNTNNKNKNRVPLINIRYQLRGCYEQ